MRDCVQDTPTFEQRKCDGRRSIDAGGSFVRVLPWGNENLVPHPSSCSIEHDRSDPLRQNAPRREGGLAAKCLTKPSRGKAPSVVGSMQQSAPRLATEQARGRLLGTKGRTPCFLSQCKEGPSTRRPSQVSAPSAAFKLKPVRVGVLMSAQGVDGSLAIASIQRSGSGCLHPPHPAACAHRLTHVEPTAALDHARFSPSISTHGLGPDSKSRVSWSQGCRGSVSRLSVLANDQEQPMLAPQFMHR